MRLDLAEHMEGLFSCDLLEQKKQRVSFLTHMPCGNLAWDLRKMIRVFVQRTWLLHFLFHVRCLWLLFHLLSAPTLAELALQSSSHYPFSPRLHILGAGNRAAYSAMYYSQRICRAPTPPHSPAKQKRQNIFISKPLSLEEKSYATVWLLWLLKSLWWLEKKSSLSWLFLNNKCLGHLRLPKDWVS